jgi:ERF superfamily
MQRSDSLANIGAALSKAQASVKVAVKNAKNPHLKNTYADLNAIWDACRVALAKNDLSVVQMPVSDEVGYVALETMLLHASGEFIASTCRARLTKDDSQGVGSALTYLKRYGLSSVMGIVADDDDDGNAASDVHEPQPFQPSNSRPTAPRPPSAEPKPSGVVVALTRELQDNFQFTPAERERRLQFTAWLAGVNISASTKELSDPQAALALKRLKACRDASSRAALVADWAGDQGSAQA